MAGKKGRSGRLPKHGAFIVKHTKDDPRPEIRKWLNIDKQAMTEDLGGIRIVTNKQQLQINNGLRILNILYHFDAYLAENGMFEKPGKPDPILNQYLAYVNALSRILQSLGLETVQREDGTSLTTIVENIKGKK